MSSFRVKSVTDLAGLGDSARKQILTKCNGEISGQPFRKALVSANDNGANNKESIETPQNPAKKTASNVNPALPVDPDSGCRYCTWPTKNPAIWLHQLLDAEFGSYAFGGRHASEVVLHGADVNYRYDHLIDGILFIEFDGFGSHKHKHEFKRDRAKQAHALKHGFIVLHLTYSDLTKRYDEIIDDVRTILESFPRYSMVLESVGKCWFRFCSRSKIST